MLTIVMYHYVRDLQRSRFPQIKGLAVEEFRGQLEYIQQHHTVLSMEEVIWAVQERADDLPEDAALLTFDDGFLDHYTCVFPLLDERGIQGSFFPPSRPVLEGKVLDVHKIHFILASSNPEMLVCELRQQYRTYEQEFDLASWDEYWRRCAQANRFDPAEVIFFKRMLQVELPEQVRGLIADDLFRRFVSCDEAAFAAELYMSVDQLRLMNRQGMHIGSHGHSHCWLNRVDPQRKADEIRQSQKLLRRINPDLGAWTISYPLGGHDPELIEMLRASGAVLGVTSAVGVANLWQDNPMALPRLDTCDLPKEPTREEVCGAQALTA